RGDASHVRPARAPGNNRVSGKRGLVRGRARLLLARGPRIVRGILAPDGATSFVIYTTLAGGLGNQMFQYAAARRAALARRTDLGLYVTAFPFDIYGRSFALRPFRIEATLIGDPTAPPQLTRHPHLRAAAWRF